ncbi:telomere stability and silencing-domain-containing protein [Gongronella butleri]|nr:telomere stability and silencing-domain-containing protein [Gongronella butleri]
MIHQQAIVQLPSQKSVCYTYDAASTTTAYTVKQQVASQFSLSTSDLIVSTLGGSLLADDAALFANTHTEQLSVGLRLRGGKGGFGSMLRAQGGRMNAQKTTNFDACRDLQGRRLRDVAAIKQQEEAAAKEEERLVQRREKFEKKIEKALKPREAPKHRFDDNEFLNEKEQVVDKVKDAVSNALKRSASSSSSSSSSASSTGSAPAAKRAKVAAPAASVFDDDLSSSDDDDDSDDSDVQSAPPAKGKGKAVAKGKAAVGAKQRAIKA